MTLTTLVLFVAAVAVLLTLIFGMAWRKVDNWLVSFLQNFTGVLFIVSGLVKAVDPLGTAFKMEQYFGEFETAFSGTWLSFLSPLFPWLSGMAIGFSVFMIVFEIALGVMLIVGIYRKLTAWLFFLLVAFFTVLTGFTYLTGYVPSGVQFFDFGSWGPYVKTNMKVTDCGCFGDFLVLEPKVSFLKDIVLLVPAIIFLFGWRSMHQVFSLGGRLALTIASIVGFTVFSFSNYAWDIPIVDFRPFKIGADIGQRRAMEEEAAANVKIIAYRMKNKSTGEVVEMPFDQYMKEFKNYPEELWELEQVQSEPAVPRTKLSDFDVSAIADGASITSQLLSDPSYSFMVISYKLYGKETKMTEVQRDTISHIDTIAGPDSTRYQTVIDSIVTRQVTVPMYEWDEAKAKPWIATVNPVLAAAKAEGLNVYAITSFSDPARVQSFQKAIGAEYPFHLADDITLKTVIRSNPGVLLLKNGVVVHKWHYKKLPDYATLKEKYMK